MKHRRVLHMFLLLLLLCELTGAQEKDFKVKVTTVQEGYKITCGTDSNVTMSNGGIEVVKPLKFKDENSMEYKCVSKDPVGEASIFVKFRTCDNCVELNMTTISGLLVGNLVATIAIGVSVYLVASKGQFGTSRSSKRGSDQQNLAKGGRGPNDVYERLQRSTQDTYDQLDRRRKPDAAYQ
ncbi:T-cell surface glycoprotein CD3 gamma chain-like [Synchiropus splendidus]|uniref:T-cell surface glycoprotein CD3 gamma chain-like n=1 Tax=Synchiropus splendidus TaxID=270530 RepID=UPI00237DCE74|nr:T-cell surface glycoprotein CD3 gamma chain-like [Synchiropus splendidus]